MVNVTRVQVLDDGPGTFGRPRLVDLLRVGARGPLTVITAPAGYGKSAAVDQWAAEHRGIPLAVVRLRADDDAAALARRLLVATADLGATVDPATTARLHHGVAVLDEGFVAGVHHELRSVGDAILVIDGLDAPRDAGLVVALGMLIAQAPPRLRVVVTRRSRRPSALNDVLKRRRAAMLDHADLAFTRDEARVFLRDESGRDIADRHLDAILERTEGWPFALRLAQLALGRASDPDAAIEGISGDDRRLTAFFREELLAGLSPLTRFFLLGTSTLDELCAPLCDAVIGCENSAVMLRFLEHRGLFTRRVSPDASSFAYHPLFRQFLRRELRLSGAGSEIGLLRRAATWHIDHDQPEHAARYLTAAEDWDGVVGLADRFGRPLFERGDARLVLQWLDALPNGGVPRRDVALRRAVLHTMLGETRCAEQVAHDAKNELTPGERIVIDAVRSCWAFMDAPSEPVIAASETVMSTLDTVDPDDIPDVFGLTSPTNLRMIAAVTRARALWYTGDLVHSRAALRSALEQRNVYLPWRIHALSALALIEAWAGNLTAARHHANHALRAASLTGLARHPAVADAYLAAAHVFRERGDQLRAETLLDGAHAITVAMRRPTNLALYTVERALCDLSDKQPASGLDAIARCRAKGPPPPPPVVESRLRTVEIELLLALGDTERAQSVLAEGSALTPTALAAMGVRVAVARRDLVTARAELDRWVVADADAYARLERDLWACVLEFESGRRRQALGLASSVIETARAEGHVRLFLDAGDPAERLLRALANGAPAPYVSQLLRSAATQREGSDVGLSERELAVVRYLPTSLSNAEIAAQLYISLNTLKTHLRTIYRKLGVNGRREAIRRAEDLGIA